VKDLVHQIGADRNPDLGLYRVGAGAVVMFEMQVAFDPAKKQIDVPAQLVEHGDRQSRNFQVLGQKHELFSGLQTAVRAGCASVFQKPIRCRRRDRPRGGGLA